jgi:single-stranded-DNA-specific exonuclease
MPRAYAVINPNRRDEEDSKLGALAGVGVAFAVCLQVKKELEKDGSQTPSIYPLLQYVAIGTICDLAHLNPMNLKLTRHGLKQIIETEYKGIEAFFNDEDRNAPTIPSEKISFYVGPLINSKGRLDHPEKALNLLIAKDHKSAFENYSHLEISNRERKLIQNEVYSEAKKLVIKDMQRDSHLISVIYAPHWHEGVIGIVASKLVETFGVPALVFSDSEEKGIIKASCRSAGDLDLYALLKDCEDLFMKFGGHKAACGLSMEKENFYRLKDRLNKALENVPEIVRKNQLTFDAEISFNDISPQLVREFDKMEPFGMGNEKPLLRMSDAQIDSYSLLKDIHVKWFFKAKQNPKAKIQGISFHYIGKWDTPTPDELFKWQQEGNIHIYFRLGINRFRGNETIQLMVEKITKA